MINLSRKLIKFNFNRNNIDCKPFNALSPRFHAFAFLFFHLSSFKVKLISSIHVFLLLKLYCFPIFHNSEIISLRDLRHLSWWLGHHESISGVLFCQPAWFWGFFNLSSPSLRQPLLIPLSLSDFNFSVYKYQFPVSANPLWI